MSPNTIFLLLLLLGVGLLIAGGFACRYLVRGFRFGRIARVWLVAEFCAIIAGITLGCIFSVYKVQLTPTLIMHGFPFLEGVDELIDGRWEDFVGVITFPALAGNFLVGVLIPQIVLAMVVWVKLKSPQTPAQPPDPVR